MIIGSPWDHDGIWIERIDQPLASRYHWGQLFGKFKKGFLKAPKKVKGDDTGMVNEPDMELNTWAGAYKSLSCNKELNNLPLIEGNNPR
eukprot:scaffold21210_cov53-Attheya_sp.AAC.6